MNPAGESLKSRADSMLPERLARSAKVTRAGSWMRTVDVHSWFLERRAATQFSVERIPLDHLAGWDSDENTGNLVHHSGKFFSVEGLRVTIDDHQSGWQQPIIYQPEVGILGILAKKFDGILHFLMQAKTEPGNPNLLQLSPTVQATRSNYTRIHNGSKVKYLEYFSEPGRGRVIADALQAEHGSWFYRKSNRNIIVEVDDDVPFDDNFRWLTLGQIGELLRLDNVVNMDARTVLACAPVSMSDTSALHSDVDVLSWFTAERARRDVRVQLMPLHDVRHWIRGEHAIEHQAGRYFRVIAVAVQADNREVAGWTQPLFEPIGLGINALVMRRFDGIPHFLLHARSEVGFLDTIELGPTVQFTPESYAHLDSSVLPGFWPLVREARADSIRYEAIHSEEGGRFFHAESRYLIIEAGPEGAPTHPPASYRWLNQAQLGYLVKHGHYLNVQLRTMLAALNADAVDL